MKTTTILLLLFFGLKITAQDCINLSNASPNYVIYTAEHANTSTVKAIGVGENTNFLGECAIELDFGYESISFADGELFASGSEGISVGMINENDFGLSFLDVYYYNLGTSFYEPFQIKQIGANLFYTQQGEVFLHKSNNEDISLKITDVPQTIRGLSGYFKDNQYVLFLSADKYIYKVTFNGNDFTNVQEITNVQQEIIYTTTYQITSSEWHNNSLYFVKDDFKLIKMNENGSNATEIGDFQNTNELVSRIQDISIEPTTGALFLSVYTQGTASGSVWTSSVGRFFPETNTFTALTIRNQNTHQDYINSYESIAVYLANDDNLSTLNFKKEKVEVFPNPVSDFLTITASENSPYKLYSLTGKLLLKGTIQHQKINMQSFEKGMYLLQINNTNHKIIKN